MDGQENPISNIFEQNYVEVQKYMTLSNHLYTAGANVINEEWFNALPADMQEIIMDAAAKGQEQSGKDLINCEEQMLDYMKSAGMEVTELTPEAQEEFKNRAMSMWDEAGGVMGQEYWDSVRSAIEDVVSGM